MENGRGDKNTNDATSEASAVPSQDTTGPDGGRRAWLMALSCFFINFCITSVTLLMSTAMAKFKAVFGTEESNEIMKALQYTGEVGILIGGILMEFIGYRIVGMVGCGMIAVGLFITSFLDKGDHEAVIFLTGVVTGTGIAFTHLATSVPIQECFVTRRILAIVFVRFGQYLALIIYTTIMLVETDLEYEWNHLLRYQLIGSCIALLICFTLKQYYHKEKATLRDLLFKYKALYVLSIVFFFDQFGKNVVDVTYLTEKLGGKLDSNSELKDRLIVGLSPSVGLILGLIVVLVLLRFKRMKKLTSILLLMAILNIVCGSFTLAFYKHMKEVGILAFYGLLYGSTSGTFSSVLDNVIPAEFEMQNVRIVEAVLGLASSLGGISAGESKDDITDDKTFTQFNLAGALILVSGALALAYAIWLIVKKRRERQDS